MTTNFPTVLDVDQLCADLALGPGPRPLENQELLKF